MSWPEAVPNQKKGARIASAVAAEIADALSHARIPSLPDLPCDEETSVIL
jgi:hypothetical protein